MLYVWSYVKRHKWLLFLNLLGAICFVTVNLGLPTILARIINEVLVSQDKGRLYFLVSIMGAIIVFGLLGNIILTYASSRLTNETTRSIRNDLYDKISDFSHEEYEKIGVSSLVTRITNDAFVILQFVEMVLRIGFNTPLMFIGSVVLIIQTSPSLSWILAAALPVIMLVIYWIAKSSGPLSDKMQKLLDKLNTYSRENLTGLRVIRAFSREEYQEEKFSGANRDYAETAQSLHKLMGSAMPAFYHIMAVVITLIFVFSLDPIGAGEMQVGTLVAFVEYAFHALFSVLMFSQIFMMYPRANVSAKRLKEIYDMPISITSKPDGVSETKTHGYIEFDNVSFAYPGETENPVLHDISFKAKPGEIVAFIGSTGSGKSTLVQLIPRFFDVTFGRIIIDGVDVRDYQLDALRNKIGFIPQRALLFTGTIGDNLRFGKDDATDGELVKASDVAQAREFIERMEEDYHSYLSEGGSNLSGGQKQRLSIARAIVKQPDIYVFDDSFSALDYRTDAEVRRRLKEVTGDSTVIIVAQRISSIRNADQIIVLEEGKIVGRGTHDKLMKTNAIYQAIAKSQLKEEQEDHFDE
ncbi:ABC transporter ATP-binding protein/permease [Amphibacillus sp. MSJ-3]|uniref:ABC transporter ATP-binding protein n=1 Tax=Amphibacillus sp. MSJ-3 TaxID=2841505 RepID=UPI001C0EF55E|nr:ABC transporter ATP-binding protein/permease [Amphibacillus sp. MSJ-3]